MSAALVVGLAGGIIVILQDGKVIDTILFNLAKGMEGLGQVATVGMMYVIQTLINLVIPSRKRPKRPLPCLSWPHSRS